MDWDEFRGLGWLQGETENSRVNDARQQIGTQWSWGADWYSSEDNLGTLFDFLSAPGSRYGEDGRPGSGERPELLDELDRLPDAGEGEEADEDERATWLEAVANEAYWDQFWVIPENRYDAPEYSEPYRMYYRYDKLTEVYEWNADPQNAPDAWLSQEEADALVAAGEPGGDEAESGYSAPTWDESWQMLFRVDAAGIYQYAYSDDQQTVRPGTDWLSYDEVMQGTGATIEATTEEAPAAELSAEQAAEVAARSRTELADQVQQAGLAQDITREDLEQFVAQLLAERLAVGG